MKKAGVTKTKRNQKRERKKLPRHGMFVPTGVSQRALEIRTVRAGTYAAAILYSGKLRQNWIKPIAAAKYLAEEIRINPSVGWRLVEQEVKWRRNVKGFVPKMLKVLGEYLEDEQDVFAKMDSKIADIVEQHPDYTIKDITFELSKQYPERKWTEPEFKTLGRRVQRLLEHVHR